MEFPSPNGDNQAALSDVSSKNIEERPDPSSLEIPQPMEAPHMAIDDGREYGCKYCHKKFSNKQALGGHQNAHKVEREMEKNARDLHENHFASYFGGSSSYQGLSTNPFLGSYNKSHDFVNRSFYDHPYNPHSQQNGVQIGYDARPGLPLAGGDPYAHVRPELGFNNVYSGSDATGPRINPQFPGQGSHNMQNHGSINKFSNMEAGSSSSRLFYHDMSGFPIRRIRPERNIGEGQNGNQMNDPGNQQVGDDDIDLSLKL